MNTARASGAPCAVATEYHVPDLGDETPATTGDVTTQSLHILDNAGTTRASCNGKAGPGFDTCGANGTDNCCRSASVPAGHAGTINVASHVGSGTEVVGKVPRGISSARPRAVAEDGFLEAAS